MPQINCHNFSPLHFTNAIATKFFFFNSFPRFRQLGCHKFFFPPIFDNLVATMLIFSLLPSLQFRQLGCQNWFLFGHSTYYQHLGTSHSLGQQLQVARILVILLSKFNFFSLLHHITYLYSLSLSYFLLQFRQHHCRNSLSFQITLNSTYITNKLNFLQYLAKRLDKRSKPHVGKVTFFKSQTGKVILSQITDGIDLL